MSRTRGHRDSSNLGYVYSRASWRTFKRSSREALTVAVSRRHNHRNASMSEADGDSDWEDFILPNRVKL